MKIQNNKIVYFEQEIRSEGILLAKLKRKLRFRPRCIGQATYDAMLGCSAGDYIQTEDNSVAEITYNKGLYQTIPRSKFSKKHPQPTVGMMVSSNFEGRVMTAIIKEVKDDTITIDANYIWIGKHLKATIHILDVRNPTQSETVEELIDERVNLL